ncbi:MAG: hypothetical protein ABIP90_05350 [Vicinamibacterales bacterium]
MSLFDLPTGGTAALPPAGPPLTTSGPLNQSRRVSTWFVGDGALLLNGVNAEFGVANRIAPLDPALAALGLTGANAPAIGVRVRRVVNSNLTAEFSAEMMPGSRKLSAQLVEAAEAARASFVTAFTGLLNTGPFINSAVTATTALSNRSSRDLATTVAAQWTFHAGSMEPYVSIGGGLVHKVGDLPSVTLTGNYRFSVQGVQTTVPINETDILRLRYDQGSALVGLVGAGVRRNISDRYGFSLDARLLLGQQTLTMRLDSTPTVAAGAPEGFIESFSTPAIQFSNSRNTGRESTLSGEPLNSFKAFSTQGLQTRYIVSAGVFFRF